MSSMTYAARRNQNLYRQKAKVQLGPFSIGFVTIAVVSVLALLYLNQITKTSVYGYKLTELSKQRDTAIAAKQELEVEAARLQSIQQIQSSPVVKGMVAEQKPTYAKAR